VDGQDVAGLWEGHGEIYQTANGTLRRRAKTGSNFGVKLPVAVMHWPTPVAGMADRGDRGDLNTAVKGYESKHTRPWPTPKASPSGPDFAWTNRKGSGGDDLATAVARETFPTPTTQGAHNNGGPGQAKRNSPPLNSVAGGQLNPPFVEWLMGFPLGWTDLEDSATP
jgi:hypothetical protein